MCEVKLFGTWFSPYVKRVEVALKLKGVEYEFIEEDLTKKSPLLLHYNPILQKVPVLVHNGKPIVESLLILEYIDGVFEGPSILPKDPHDRAMSRFWAKFVQEKCMVAARKACMSGGEEREKAKKEAEEGLTILDNEIKGKRFFGGDEIGLVDLAANSFAFWYQILQEEAGVEILSEEKFPNLWKWGEEFYNDSLVNEFFPNRKKMALGFNKTLESGKLYPSLSLVHATFVEEIDNN